MKTAIVTLLCMAALTFAKTMEKEFKHQFKNLESNARLYLKHGDGDVTLETWDKDFIDIYVYYRVSSSGYTKMVDEFYVEFEERNNEYSIIGHEPSVRMVFGSIRTIYTYTIKAPAHVSLKTIGADGDVEISGRQADMSIRLSDGDLNLDDSKADRVTINISDGDIRIDELESELSIQSSDGNVDIDDLKSNMCRISLTDGDIRIFGAAGNFKLQSTDGNIDLNRIATQELFAKSSDGDIEIDLADVQEPDIEIETGDGNITLHIPSSTNASIKAYTNDGNIRASLDNVKEKEAHEHYFDGVLKDGQGRIRIRSGDGDISLYEH